MYASAAPVNGGMKVVTDIFKDINTTGQVGTRQAGERGLITSINNLSGSLLYKSSNCAVAAAAAAMSKCLLDFSYS